MAKIQGRMNHVWVLEHRDGKVSAKRNEKGELNPYHTRQGHSKRDDVATIGLNDEQGKPIAVVDVPTGAEVFQRHRCWVPGSGINYYNKFYTAIITLPSSMQALIPSKTKSGEFEWVDCPYDAQANVYQFPANYVNHMFVPERKVNKQFPEVTYGEVWLVGWRKRESDGIVTVHYKAIYPDGRIDEHSGWGEKPWLFEPEWFSEEQV